MAGAGAGRDARPHGLDQADGALGGERVEVGRRRVFELGPAVGVGVATEAVQHDQDDPGVGRLGQGREVERHWAKPR